MRRILLVAATAAVAMLAFAGVSTAQSESTIATDVYAVSVDRYDPTVAYVVASYSCVGGMTENTHLWVSVKQDANRGYNPALAEEGSSAISAAWSQSHPTAQVNCDGRTHFQIFRVDHSEYGFGQLGAGIAWVQFCLFGGDGAFSFTQVFMPIWGPRGTGLFR